MKTNIKTVFLGFLAFTCVALQPVCRADILYISSSFNNSVVRVYSNGTSSIFASGLSPDGLAFDSAANLYVANAGSSTIEKFTPEGAGSTFSDPGYGYPIGVAFDRAGNLYVSDLGFGTITKITSDGTSSVFASGLSGSFGLAFDSADNLYVACRGNNTIAKFDSQGVGSVFASTGLSVPVALAFDSAGNLYALNRGTRSIQKFTPDGVGSVFIVFASTRVKSPFALAFDSAGSLYVAESDYNRVEKVSSEGSDLGAFADSSMGLSGPNALAFTDDAGVPLPLANQIPLPGVPTPVGANVPVDAGTVGSTNIELRFPQVTSAGSTTVTLIDPNSAGSLPANYALAGSDLAFEIETTAAYAAPVTIAFQVPSMDAVTFSQLRVLHNENGTLVDRTASSPAPDAANKIIYASVPSLSPFILAKRILSAKIQPPINSNGSSVFDVKEGDVPVRFTLTQGGNTTCLLPKATIAVTRLAGDAPGPVNPSVYSKKADAGPNFKIDRCNYLYKLNLKDLGVGTYRIDLQINGQVIGSGEFRVETPGKHTKPHS